MTDPKLRSDRPIMVCDMLIGNTLAGQEFDSLDESLVVTDGKITVSKKSKLIQVKDEIEWCACNVRLQTYMVEHGLLAQGEVMPYSHYSLKIMDLMRIKQFGAVMEFDWMCRLSVWRGVSTWGSSFTHEYEAAFTDKSNGACKHVSALWCTFCSSETHNPVVWSLAYFAAQTMVVASLGVVHLTTPRAPLLLRGQPSLPETRLPTHPHLSQQVIPCPGRVPSGGPLMASRPVSCGTQKGSASMVQTAGICTPANTYDMLLICMIHDVISYDISATIC